jgi:hypothetical protein
LAVSGLVVSAAVGAGPSAGGAGEAPRVETVAGFAMKVTAALGVQTMDARGAVAALRALGCRLNDPMAPAPLTEGRAADIMADLGLSVLPPADPAKPVSPTRATLLAAITGMTSPAIFPLPSPVEPPTQCLSEKNLGQCVDCCKDAVHCSANGSFALSCNVCARFCQNNVPPLPSDSAPLP